MADPTVGGLHQNVRAIMRFRSRLLVGALVLALGSCGQCGSSSSSVPAVHLVFTGPAAGTPANGSSGCQAFTTSKRFGYELDGAQMNGQVVVLTMTVYSNFNGQGTYPVGTVLDGGAVDFGDEAACAGELGTVETNAFAKQVQFVRRLSRVLASAAADVDAEFIRQRLQPARGDLPERCGRGDLPMGLR